MATSFGVVAQTTDGQRFAYTEIFIRSPIVYGYCVGQECEPTREFSAFRQASYDHGDVVPYLLAQFDRATAAGRIYIVQVIQHHSPTQATPVYRSLKQDQRKVKFLAGCVLFDETMAVAAEELERNPNGFDQESPVGPY